MRKDNRNREIVERRSWFPDFDFFGAFFAFWFGPAPEDRALEPIPIRIRDRRR